MSGNATGASGPVIQSLTGFHMNALLALMIVLALLLGLLFLVNRLKKFMPLFFNKQLPSKGALSVSDVLQLDSRRKLISVSVESPGGKKALAVLLVGGANDLCIGWLDETPSHPSHDTHLKYVSDKKEAEKHVSEH